MPEAGPLNTVNVSIAALIPTRARPDLALAAARSLLDQGVEIYVSDNSASPEPLRTLCAAEPRITYLRPPRELAMPDHWDWAIGEVLARSAASHVTVHYDRKISKPGAWERLAKVAAADPEMLVTFPLDQVTHFPPPLRLWQAPWTGKVFEAQCATVAAAIAEGRLDEIAQALPILSNCVVPRTVLEAIRARFGDYCRSTGPDSAFTARFLSLFDSYRHFDRACGILYGTRRSNGLGYLRGKGGDFADFRNMFGAGDWLAAAPLPGVNLGQNMLYHEYELVRRATGERLPPLDRAAIIEDLGRALVWIADPEVKAGMAAMLLAEGWSGAEAPPFERPKWAVRREELKCRWRMARHGEVPPHISGFRFRSDRNALRFALRYPRAPDAEAPHLAALDAAEVPS
jgi:hypothetical protein